MHKFTVLSSALLITAAAIAHVDDPKATELEPPYLGPGYRADLDGPAAGAPQFPSENVTLKSWITIGEFGSEGQANDCWGYVSPSGREYAMIGLWEATGFVEVTEPGNAQIVEVLPALASVWRDIKVYGEYAYIVTEESGGGIQIVDLSQIDDGTVTLVNTVTTGGSTKSHNVALNMESGFLYRCGGSGHGLRIYSLADPANPTFVGEWNDRYVHDAQVVTMQAGPFAGREIAFCCGGFNGGWVDTGLDVLDVTDKDDIQLIGQVLYPNGTYSHQGWLSEDQQTFYLGDELDEGTDGIPTTTFVIDVSTLTNPRFTSTFTNGNPATGHNLYTKGDLIYQANYTSGLRIFDATTPDAPVEVAYFDTYPSEDVSGYSGMWSNFPYFPSGTVIGSDRQNGLFVLQVDLAVPVAGDVDGDGAVGFSDLTTLLASWGPCPGCPADLDGDGQVGLSDLLMVLGGWTS